MKSLLAVVIAASTMCLVATAAFATAGTPIQGTDVGLDGVPGGRITQGKTDARGTVMFGKLNGGNYNVGIGSTKIPCRVTVTGGTARVARELPASGGKIPVTIPKAGGSLTVTITTAR